MNMDSEKGFGIEDDLSTQGESARILAIPIAALPGDEATKAEP